MRYAPIFPAPEGEQLPRGTSHLSPIWTNGGREEWRVVVAEAVQESSGVVKISHRPPSRPGMSQRRTAGGGHMQSGISEAEMPRWQRVWPWGSPQNRCNVSEEPSSGCLGCADFTDSHPRNGLAELTTGVRFSCWAGPVETPLNCLIYSNLSPWRAPCHWCCITSEILRTALNRAGTATEKSMPMPV